MHSERGHCPPGWCFIGLVPPRSVRIGPEGLGEMTIDLQQNAKVTCVEHVFDLADGGETAPVVRHLQQHPARGGRVDRAAAFGHAQR